MFLNLIFFKIIMLNQKERLILKELRQNSRESLSRLSKKTNIPVSTIFEILRKLENKVITKHVSIVDFSKLGYGLRVNLLISSKDKSGLMNFLKASACVNSLSSSLNGHDYYAECMFRDMKEMAKFKERLENFDVDVDEIFVLDEIKREGFQLR